MSEHLYVPTDAKGTQYFGERQITWSPPVRAEGGGFTPGEVVLAEGRSPLPLLSLDGLLDEDLGERIFVAEIEPGAGAALVSFGVEADAARLVSETDWSAAEAARFALDCARHVLGERASVALPSGSSLGEVLDAAERWLAEADSESAGLLGRVARLATLHRLRRQSDAVGELAFGVSLADIEQDLNVLDDPDWVSIAATRDAVLAAVEAIRHQSFPHLVEDENVRYELDSAGTDVPPEPVTTPWGSFMAGRRSGVVPAWVAARDAAERARQAAADTGGAEAGRAEREWQRRRLLAALA